MYKPPTLECRIRYVALPQSIRALSKRNDKRQMIADPAAFVEGAAGIICFPARHSPASERRRRSWDVQKGSHSPRTLCATQDPARGYGLRSVYVSRPAPDICWDRLGESPLNVRLSQRNRYGGDFHRMRPNQDLHQSSAT